MKIFRLVLPLLAGTVAVVCCASASNSVVEARPLPASSRLLHLLAVSEAQDAAPKKAAEPLPDGKGRDATIKVCTKCHGTDQFSHLRQSKAKWSATIDRMISKGLEASDEELDQVTEYLATAFPVAAGKDDAASAKPTNH